jgi:hypothetical protein
MALVNNPLLIVKRIIMNYNVPNATSNSNISCEFNIRNVYDMLGYDSWQLFNLIQRQDTLV